MQTRPDDPEIAEKTNAFFFFDQDDFVSTEEREKSEQEKKQSKKVLHELKSVLLVKQKEFQVRHYEPQYLVFQQHDIKLVNKWGRTAKLLEGLLVARQVRGSNLSMVPRRDTEQHQ